MAKIRVETATLAEIAGLILSNHSLRLVRPVKDQIEGEPIKYEFKDYEGNKTNRWVLLDAVTANAIATVYNALGEDNRAKFDRLPLCKAVNVVWKLVKR